MKSAYWLFAITLLFSCNNINPPSKSEAEESGDETTEESTIQLDKLNLPTGFEIEVFAKDVVNARSMALSPSGTLLWAQEEMVESMH